MRGGFRIFTAFTLYLALLPGFAENPDRQLHILTSFPPDFYHSFQSAFTTRHPEIQVVIRNKKTTAGINYLQRQPDNMFDLFWASAPDAFAILDNAGLLQSVASIEFGFPDSISGYPLKQADNRYFGFALSGYGIMSNRAYTQRWGLPVATQWADLARPVYFSHLGISSPSRSGTTHLMMEMILQQYGWDEGWKYILQIASNAVTITARSYGVPEGIQQGRFGLGLVIDFLARKIDSSDIEFEYAAETRYLPASIALLKHSKNQTEAQQFMRFVLSREGQQLLQDPGIARLPVDPDLYANQRKQINPYSLAARNPAKAFDSRISRQRYQLLNVIFDHLITFQHKSLQRLRGKLIQASKTLDQLNEPATELTRELTEIEARLFDFPIAEALSLDQKLLGKITRHDNSVLLSDYLPQPLASIKENWIRRLIELEGRVERLLSEVDETQ